MIIICRCEDITEEDILRVIDTYDCTTIAELKQILRLGMGQCQGRTCLLLAAKILSKKTGKSIQELMISIRPPDVPVKIGTMGDDDEA